MFVDNGTADIDIGATQPCSSSVIVMPMISVTMEDLTYKEKVALLSGDSFWTTPPIPRLNVPHLTMADGPHGVRRPVHELALNESHPATCFPTACALACSWDEDLVREVGVALQQECIHYNVHVLLGPGLNLKRHPLGGRNFEYFSEDPFLSGRLASAYIQGVQCTGKVAACVKHFAANNQESHRFVVNALVDERTLRELYYKGFELTINRPADQQPATLMCAYNRLNGIFCSEHSELLTDVLRNEWDFKGLTITDWGAANFRPAGLVAGMDLEMPGSHGAHHWEIKEHIRNGMLDEKYIDASVQRMLTLIQKYGTGNPKPLIGYDKDDLMWKNHFELARKVAMDCCVLLKNEDGLLPLKAETISKVALIGDFGRGHPRYQGMGSSSVQSEKVVTVYDELHRFIHDPSNITFAPGYEVDDDHPELVDTLMVEEAVEAAKGADVVIICVGLPEIMESEGFDRVHMRMPAQHNALVDAVSKANSNVIVVLSNGGVVELPWHDHVKAILETYLLGEAGGAAVVDLIFGVQSPCGKLPETFPGRVEDILADQYFPGNRDRVEHREGLLVGYRYFDTVSVPVRFPFGHGLSYTTFKYSALGLTTVTDEIDKKLVSAILTVTNTGATAGKEIVQCYVHSAESKVFRPEQELKDFAKVSLDPGQSKEVTFTLTNNAFSFYDIGLKTWVVEEGEFEVRIGSSSRDIRLKGTIFFLQGLSASQIARESYPTEKMSDVASIDDAKFANRFGNKSEEVLMTLAENPAATGKVFHRNSLLKEVAESRLVGKVLLYTVFRASAKGIKKGPTSKRGERMVMENVKNIPLRALVLFSRGGLSFDTLDALIDLMNMRVLVALIGFGRALYHFVRPKK